MNGRRATRHAVFFDDCRVARSGATRIRGVIVGGGALRGGILGRRGDGARDGPMVEDHRRLVVRNSDTAMLAGAGVGFPRASRSRGEVGMVLRIGDLLVRQGVLTEQQVQDILTEQPRGGAAVWRTCRAAVRRFAPGMWNGHGRSSIRRSWVSTARTRPSSRAMDASITARQAWQFRVLPVRYSGDELTVCTTKDHLARALRFVGWKIQSPCHFASGGAGRTGSGRLMKHFPLAGASVGMVTGKTIGAV